MGSAAVVALPVALAAASADDLTKLSLSLPQRECERLASLLSQLEYEGKADGQGVVKNDDASTEGVDKNDDASSEGSDWEPGPLEEGDYIWRPVEPVRMFTSSFGSMAENESAQLYGLSEFTLTDFLGSGAEGTVYKANYLNLNGELCTCAIKFNMIFPEEAPNSHAAIELLLNRSDNVVTSAYERETNAFSLLRPKSRSQFKSFAGGSIRLVQLLGFHDASVALILELVDGKHPPESDMKLITAVKEFVKVIETATHVDIQDIKPGNVLKDGQGITTVIDFGICQYTGGCICRVCEQTVECGPGNIDEHAGCHVAEFMSKQLKGTPLSRMRLQEFCYGQSFV